MISKQCRELNQLSKLGIKNIKSMAVWLFRAFSFVARKSFNPNRRTTMLMGSKRSQRGVSMTETLIVAPMLLVVGFATVQMGYVWEAKNTMNYAALMAARAGAVSGLDLVAMKEAAVKGLRPILSDADRQDYELGNIANIPVEVIIVNPNLESFIRFRDLTVPCVGGVLCIPNNFLQERGAIVVGNDTLTDANLLRVELFYNYPLVVPLVGELLSAISARPRGDLLGECAAVGCPSAVEYSRIPVQGVATVRMQSISKLTVVNFDNIVTMQCVAAKINDTEPKLGGVLCPEVDFL
ncbi:MAG: pilus assembly protein [Pseudomonadales bacterium]|nr:pilus assembly protein [Pseudomonadales bacterium]